MAGNALHPRPNLPVTRGGHPHRACRRAGMILLVVLVTVALLALGALTFAELMLAEREGTEIYGRLSQARAAAASGMEAARFLTSLDEDALAENGGWFDNPTWFAGVTVREETDPRSTAYYSVISPGGQDYSTSSGVRYGLENESAKLNVNSLLLADQYVENGGRQLLMALPGMTEDVADAIMDWIDADDEPREFGAEVDYYASLSPAYAPKNGPLETVEELLLIRGVTPELLFGGDRNRNGMIDANETVPEELSALGIADTTAYRGWAAYLTLFSMELNVRPDGSAKININQDDLEDLYNRSEAELGSQVATFIIGYRQNGPYDGTEELQPLEETALPDFTRPSRATFSTVLDLIDARVRMQVEGAEEPVVVGPLWSTSQPGILRVALPLIMANLTATPSQVIPGRININLAPPSILYGIPGLDASVADAIIDFRPTDPINLDDEQYRYETWLLADGLVTLDEMKALMPFITCGGNVFKGQVVGYLGSGIPAVRHEVMIDATVRPARVLFWRDMSQLGRGFDADVLSGSATSAGLGLPEF